MSLSCALIQPQLLCLCRTISITDSSSGTPWPNPTAKTTRRKVRLNRPVLSHLLFSVVTFLFGWDAYARHTRTRKGVRGVSALLHLPERAGKSAEGGKKRKRKVAGDDGDEEGGKNIGAGLIAVTSLRLRLKLRLMRMQ